MPRWQSGTAAIAYDDQGEGSPVVLVHGHPLDRSMWQPQITWLAGHGFRAIAPDLRGYGQSSVQSGSCTLDVFARDIAGLLDELGLGQAVICGLSMGGQIALEFTRLYPGRVRALVLADTSAPADTEDGARGRHATADRLLADGMAGYAAEVLPKMISARTIARQPSVAARVLEMMRAADPAGAAAALRGRSARPDYRPLLPAITVPALVVVGAEDEFTPLPDARVLAAGIARSALTVVPGAGHLPNLEQPGTFNHALADFLAGLTPAGPARIGA